jgi:hypothetical protein
MKLFILTAAATLAFSAERFDMEVRNDFFAGFSGNKEAFDRAMQKSEAVIAANPKHAEAMVWHGGGLMMLSRIAFQSGDTQKGSELFAHAQKEMDDAVALAPDNVGVRIPRGAVLMSAGRGIHERNPELGRKMLEKAAFDYEHVYNLQSARLSQLGQHPLGELLFGIADTNSRLGNQERAAEFFDKIATMLPNTAYAKRAALWRETKSLPLAQTGCIGCHTAAVK